MFGSETIKNKKKAPDQPGLIISSMEIITEL